MSAGWNAEAVEPNAYHKTEDLNDDDASLFGTGPVSWWSWIDGLRDVKAMREHKVDIKVSTIIESEAKIVKQVSSGRPAGMTRVRVEPRAAALTPNTAANTSDETSWDRAEARSWAGGIANSLMPNRLDIAYDIEEVFERISTMP